MTMDNVYIVVKRAPSRRSIEHFNKLGYALENCKSCGGTGGGGNDLKGDCNACNGRGWFATRPKNHGVICHS